MRRVCDPTLGRRRSVRPSTRSELERRGERRFSGKEVKSEIALHRWSPMGELARAYRDGQERSCIGAFPRINLDWGPYAEDWVAGIA
jgi:hypothetical protein